MCAATEKPRGIGILWISCKWWGWSNGDKNQKQKKSLTKPENSLDQPQNNFGCTSFAERLGRDTQALALPRIFKLFWIPYPQKNLYFLSREFLGGGGGEYLFGWLRLKYLSNFLSHPKKFRNQKFQTQKNPSIISVQYPIHPLGGENGATAMKSLWLHVSLLYPSSEWSTRCTHNGRCTI